MINWPDHPHKTVISLRPPPSPIPPHPPPHTQTHWLLLAVNFLQSLVYTPCNPPSTPFILLKKYYLRWNHLTAPCGFTLVLNIVGIISMINKAADQGLLDLLNIILRNIKTNMLSIKNVQFHLIPSYPYLQVLHTLKLYSQFEEKSTKLITLVCFPCQLVFIYHFDKVLLL